MSCDLIVAQEGVSQNISNIEKLLTKPVKVSIGEVRHSDEGDGDSCDESVDEGLDQRDQVINIPEFNNKETIIIPRRG